MTAENRIVKTVGIIPARLQSSRLPEKLLLAETGKPLIQYVWEVATATGLLDQVIVATDSDRIHRVVTEFGGRAELTGDHPSGSGLAAGGRGAGRGGFLWEGDHPNGSGLTAGGRGTGRR